MDLIGRVAVVTGGARRLGRAIVEAFAREKAQVALHCNRSLQQADALASELRRTDATVEVFQADLGRPDQIQALFKAVGERFGRVDVLVNSAAVFHRTPLETLTPEQWDAEFVVNARAAALCIRHALEWFTTEGGAIVNITDISAEKAWGGYPAYCASKAALTGLTRSAAKALAKRNIRVNAVAPGAILWSETRTEAERKKVLQQIPMKRIGAPRDIAQAVLFLIRNDYVTAQTLRVDGGWHTG